MSDHASRPADQRLRRIESLIDVTLAHLDVEDLLAELLERVRELLRADTAAVLLLDPSSQYLVAAAARGLEEEVHQGTRVPVGEGFAGRIAAGKRPVVIDDVDHADVLNPILRQKRIRSLLGVPLLIGGAVIGVLHVGTLSPRRFAVEDVDLLQVVADRAALATQASLTRVGQAAATELQRSLAPARLPSVAGYEFAGRYVAGRGGSVGGDWYDVFVLPSGSVGVAVGDVVGAGLSAAVVMGRLRSALRAYALDYVDPGEVLSSLDRKVQHFEPGAMATVLYAVIEPQSHQLHVSVAGHPIPVLAVPNRPAEVLDLPIDLLIGVRPHQLRRTSTVELPPGAVICFYTDGLVERRDSTLDVGVERLRDSVTTDPAEFVCANVMNKLVGRTSLDDDIALLAVRRKPLFACHHSDSAKHEHLATTF
ncbi:MAG TPA: GAF domain-containing SpoIIE family protein phosphatase [Pseudonocardiaceae bacterium]|nr:GAF domain-containing SpoIIE family protein phosphatase [Pseudonocardiaceae bacterium]